MLGIEYFGNLEHYCFKKNVISIFFQLICDVNDDVIQINKYNNKPFLKTHYTAVSMLFTKFKNIQ